MGNETGKHKIHYHPHTSIKTQALADFRVKIPNAPKNVPTVLPIDPSKPEASRDIWELYIKRNALNESFGKRVILKNPDGDEIMYALRFNF